MISESHDMISDSWSLLPNPEQGVQDLVKTSPHEILAARYFLRLEEAMEVLFPTIPPPQIAHPSTLDDFYLAVRKLTTTHDLPGLGFEFGSRIRISDYGIVGLAMASSRNLAEAIEIQLRFLNIITNTSKVMYQFVRTEEWMTLKLFDATQGRRLDQFTIESELGAQVRLVMDLLPSANFSQCILSLPYKCPSTRQVYNNKGSYKVRFDQPAAQLQLPHDWADTPLDSADELLAPMIVERCQMIVAQLNRGNDWVQKVQWFLLTSDSSSKGLSQTAEALGVSTAKLRWQLSRSKTNYKQILLDVRMKLACQFLKDTPLTLQQVSYQLGYTYPSNFQLAFKKYFNNSPGEWRRLQAGNIV